MIKESEEKESRGWKYKELEFDFIEQISMFDKGEEYENSNNKKQE